MSPRKPRHSILDSQKEWDSLKPILKYDIMSKQLEFKTKPRRFQ